MDDSPDTLQPEVRIAPRLVDSFYTEAMLLADEARSLFRRCRRYARQELNPFARVGSLVNR